MSALKNIEGHNVPDVTLMFRKDGDWAKVTTDDLFANKTVVVFSLPGAFTPTCSSSHLPRYNELAPIFKTHGVDSIVCVSVNDPFVMEEWARDQESENVMLLPDGAGAFTRGMGMMVDKSAINFGDRSWRYSMLVKNKKIEKMFIEPVKEGDPFEVSDADTMLNFIDPSAKGPDQVAILTRIGCPHCAHAKKALTAAGLDYVEVPLGHTIRTKAVGAISGGKTVPQVFINGELIGGADELDLYLKKAA